MRTKRLLVVLILGVFVAAFPFWKGDAVSSRAVTDESTELGTQHLERLEIGRRIFEEYLSNQGKSYKRGTKEYLDELLRYVDNQGLRQKNPEKWELVDDYAYDCYVREEYSKKSPKPQLKPDKPGETTKPNEGVSVTGSGGGVGSYNRNGSVNYAYTHVFSPNSAYRNMTPVLLHKFHIPGVA